VRATNQKIQLKGMSFLRIRGGKIVYQSQVYDSAALNRQLGL
jgi:predicted ester cyclase